MCRIWILFLLLGCCLSGQHRAWAHGPSEEYEAHSAAVEELDAYLANLVERIGQSPQGTWISDEDWARIEQLRRLSYERDVVDKITEPALNTVGKVLKLLPDPRRAAWAIRHPVQAVNAFRGWVTEKWKTPLGKAVILNEVFLEPGLGFAGSRVGGEALVLVPLTMTHVWDILFYGSVLGLPKVVKAVKTLVQRGGILSYYQALKTNPEELLKRVQGLARVSMAGGRETEVVIVDGGRGLPEFLRVATSPAGLAAEKQFVTVSIQELEAIARRHGAYLGDYKAISHERFVYSLHLLQEEISRRPEAQEDLGRILSRRLAARPNCGARLELGGGQD